MALTLLKRLRLTVLILTMLSFSFLILFALFIRYSINPLDFKNIPEYYFAEPDNFHSESEEPPGYEKRQFAVCLFQRWCSYDYIQKDYFVIFRNNNKYSDTQFGSVKEVKDQTYIIEITSPDKQKSLKEIPKNWVFGKD